MPEQPNILFVTVDSLRADHAYGEQAITPNFDSLAEGGTIFESAFAQGPYTTFSMPSLFTSRYPSQLTSIDFVDGVEGVLVEDAPTIQGRLHDSETKLRYDVEHIRRQSFWFDVKIVVRQVYMVVMSALLVVIS